ncbi:MAG TPA: glycosyltransferase family 2 protein [Planctomycetota bacterium]|nr:glycosyltransferase family 2 protein [Planctomycetota bacterium]
MKSPSSTTCAAVVVHYRDEVSTLLCLASLLRQNPDLEVVIVDNCSPDGSGRELQRSLAEQPGVHLVHSDRNGGFGAGCNLGIEFALARWPGLQHVVLLNPDAEMEPGALGEMIGTSRRHPKAGIVGCRIEDGDGRTSFANGRRPTWTLSGFHCAAPSDAEHPSEFVTAACMLIAADLLRDGLRFCETYFLYCEDVDLCCEVRARGRELWVTQAARVRHLGGGSQPGRPVLGELTGERLFWLTRGKMILARRRLGLLQRLCFLAAACIGKPLVGLAMTRSPRFLVPYFKGLFAGLCRPDSVPRVSVR